MEILQPSFSDSKRHTLRQKFDGIKKGLSIAEDERQQKRLQVKNILDELIALMKQEDSLFRQMFVELKYTGSYFDNLRIKDANEFDINVVLALPVRKDKILLSESSYVYSNYVSLEVDFSREEPTVGLDHDTRGKFMKRILDYNQLVHPQLVLNWFQGVMAKACNKLQNLSSKFDISASGPAKTLKIKFLNQKETVDVDLVPVFRFEPGTWKEKCSFFRQDIVDTVAKPRRRMYLVPKKRASGSEELWRKHFPEVEEELLNGRVAAKPVIRIMKLLRDNEGWHRVASYFIKTLVLIEVEDHKNDRTYWSDSRLPDLIFTMMAKLGECFDSGVLPHLLYRDVNLLDNLSGSELYNYYNKMKRNLIKLDLDLDYVDELFKLPEKNSPEYSAKEEPSWCNIL